MPLILTIALEELWLFVWSAMYSHRGIHPHTERKGLSRCLPSSAISNKSVYVWLDGVYSQILRLFCSDKEQKTPKTGDPPLPPCHRPHEMCLCCVTNVQSGYNFGNHGLKRKFSPPQLSIRDCTYSEFHKFAHSLECFMRISLETKTKQKKAN